MPLKPGQGGKLYKLVYKGKCEVITGFKAAVTRRSELQRQGYNPALKFA